MRITPSDELFAVCLELVLIATLPLRVEAEGISPPVAVLIMKVNKARSEPFRDFSDVGWDFFCCEDCCFCFHSRSLSHKEFVYELGILAGINRSAAYFANKSTW